MSSYIEDLPSSVAGVPLALVDAVRDRVFTRATAITDIILASLEARTPAPDALTAHI